MKALNSILSLFYPHTCPVCGKYLSENEQEQEHLEWICSDCLRKLPRTEQLWLRENSTETSILDESSNLVREKKILHLDKAAAYLFYEKGKPVQHLVHLMKYSERPQIGYYLARQAVLDTQDTDFFDNIDVIIPMPLHPKRLRERGYNQSEYIARGLSEITQIPVDTTHVLRTKNTPKQALQTGEGRKTNVENAFAVNHPEQMYHKHILVVDDLVTTGETMRSCLKAMKTFRGAKISVFSLCRTR